MDDTTQSVVKSDSGNAPAQAPESAQYPAHLTPQPHGGAMAPQFKPGQSGNPKGKPPDAERLVQRLKRRHAGILDEMADQLASILQNADHRHFMAAFKETLDRMEGSVTQQQLHHVSADRTIVTHADSGPAPMLPGDDGERVEPAPEPDKPG